MCFGPPSALIRLDVPYVVDDAAANLDVAGAGSEPAPALKSPGTQSPAFGEFLLLEVGGIQGHDLQKITSTAYRNILPFARFIKEFRYLRTTTL